MVKYIDIKIPETEETRGLLKDARIKYARENPGIKTYDYNIMVEALRRYLRK